MLPSHDIWAILKQTKSNKGHKRERVCLIKSNHDKLYYYHKEGGLNAQAAYLAQYVLLCVVLFTL